MRLIDADELIIFGLDNPDDEHLFQFVPMEIIDSAPTVELPSAQRWIPIKMRPMTDEEREYYESHLGELEDEWCEMFDCPMPYDGQKILISLSCGIVTEDVCEEDDYGIGLEGNGDWMGVSAWMPLPEPYKEEPDD